MNNSRITTSYASVVGRKHAERGLDNQDCVAVDRIEVDNGVHVTVSALADGAGSSEFGGEASQLAVARFMERSRNVLAATLEFEQSALPDMMKSCFQYARDGVLCLDRTEEHHTTLIGCWILDRGSAGIVAAIASVGDGVSIAVTGPRRHEIVKNMLPITKGEYPNMTLFLTSEDWEQVWHFAFLEAFEMLFLSTDGLDRVYFEEVFLEEDPAQEYYARYRYGVVPNEQYVLRLRDGICREELDNEQIQHILSSDLCMEHNGDDKALILHGIRDSAPSAEEQ
jgi:hypothetical protein